MNRGSSLGAGVLATGSEAFVRFIGARDTRGGSAYAHIMRHVAARLKPEQMRDVAAYYASLSAWNTRQGSEADQR